MDRRALARLPIAPGPRGVADLIDALPRAFDGQPIAPVPTTSATVSDTYVSHLLSAVRTEVPLERDDISVVLTTSGSTGAPRGVLLSAPALTASATGAADALGIPTDSSAWLVAIPVTSAGGFAVATRAWLSGLSPETLASVGGAAPFSPDDFVAATARLRRRAGERALLTSLVSAQLSRLLDSAASTEALRTYDAILIGGARFDAQLRVRAVDAGLRVTATYGMTETCGGCAYDGRTFRGVEMRAVDGELQIRGDVLALGYRLDPARTAARFVDGWLHTGDAGSVAGGIVTVTGRLDDIVQCKGVNVSTSAVERVIGSLAGVRGCAVIALPDAVAGSRLAAFVICDGDMRSQVVDAVLDELGAAAVPSVVRTVASLPALPNGKTDRAALSALVADGGIGGNTR